MFRITLKGLLANKVRLLLTSLAIVLGVGFVSGSFILSDTLSKTFDNLFASAFEGIDVIVQGESTVSENTLPPIPASILPKVQAVEGVRAAEGGVAGQAVIVVDGKAIDLGGAPALGFSWMDDPELASFQLREGRPPAAAGEVAIDAGTASDQNLAVGDTVDIITSGPAQPFRIVGLVGFGSEDNLAGASSSLFALPVAQRLYGKEGEFDQIDVAATDGTTVDELLPRIQDVLPSGAEAISAASEEQRQSEDLKSQLSFITYFLLGFALVSVFVAAFVIFNTFTITVAQRTRQLALLRAVGASGGQVIRMVMLEALVVGLIASVIGLFLGLAIAAALQGAFGALGFELPSTALQFLPRTWIVSIALGVIVTLIAAFLPARRAASIPPIAALREQAASSGRLSVRTTVIAAVITAAGFLLFFGSRAIDDTAARFIVLGAGALIALIGAAGLSQSFARMLARLIGAPLPRLFKVPGKLGRENAMRDPRRTARTAAALMIGLAVVGVVTIFASSINKSLDDLLEEQFPAELIVRTENFTTFPGTVAAAMKEQPAVGDVAAVRSGSFSSPVSELRLDGSTETVSGIDPAAIGAVFDPKFTEGDWTDLTEGGIVISKGVADDKGLSVGDTATVQMVLGEPRTLRIDGIFEETTFGDSFITLADYATGYPGDEDAAVFANAAPGSTIAEAQAQVEQVLTAYPNLTVETQDEFKDSQRGQINQLLGLVYILLALTIVIAVFGIVNTLALTVYERTREIGLLRAVGLGARQAKAMVRWESVIVALIGGILGTVLGIIFGSWLSYMIPGIGLVSIPWVSLIVFLVLAGLAGVVAAIFPARRAAKIDVLRAIAQE